MSDSRVTQNQIILEHLRKFKTITQRDALQFGCYRLASRISELKNAGHNITATIVSEKNRAGQTVRYARYYLHE